MSLRWKFFLSYLAVIAVALITLGIATALLAPADFSGRVRQMAMPHNPPALGISPDGRPMMGAMRGGMMISIAELEEELNASFRESVARAMWLAGLMAIAAAAGASLFLSLRIVEPIRALGAASQRIAGGHYEERLPIPGEDELGDLTRSFNAMAAALAETETMRQQLLADVSHELKTPLSSIKGYMEGLQDGVIAPTPDTFQLIYREADRLQRLVHDLQELSRAEADQLQLSFSAVDACELARSATEWLRPQFEDRTITLTLALPEAPLPIRADFDRARQVVLNLLGNALQYTPEGGQVTLRLWQEGPMAHFAISDTGIGLAAEDLERIFQRFYRVDKSRARSSGGSGIGLTIARHIAQAHGGELWAESPGPGKGSTFHLTLPLDSSGI
ncbi:MAG: ATP-binding protein [Anaerolineae bacterium]